MWQFNLKQLYNLLNGKWGLADGQTRPWSQAKHILHCISFHAPFCCPDIAPYPGIPPYAPFVIQAPSSRAPPCSCHIATYQSPALLLPNVAGRCHSHFWKTVTTSLGWDINMITSQSLFLQLVALAPLLLALESQIASFEVYLLHNQPKIASSYQYHFQTRPRQNWNALSL